MFHMSTELKNYIILYRKWKGLIQCDVSKAIVPQEYWFDQFFWLLNHLFESWATRGLTISCNLTFEVKTVTFQGKFPTYRVFAWKSWFNK